VVKVARSKQPQTKVVYAWQAQGVLWWFHYTTNEYAKAIAAEGYYVVSGSDHQGRGSGLFVTNRNPVELTAEELLTELFSRQRPHDAVEAVVVLRRDDANFTVAKVGHTSYLHAAEPDSIIDISPFLRGFGVRTEEAPDGWLFSGDLYVPKGT
jgi:hypothetical protein